MITVHGAHNLYQESIFYPINIIGKVFLILEGKFLNKWKYLKCFSKSILFSSPEQISGRAIALLPAAALLVALPAELAVPKCYSFYIKVFYMMGKALTGELSCLVIGLVTFKSIKGRQILQCESELSSRYNKNLKMYGYTYRRSNYVFFNFVSLLNGVSS